jgi:hypothetical protein
MRTCDYCGQKVQEEAVYCRFCQRELPANPELAGKRRCPTCAEWIDRGEVICPLCEHTVSADPALGKPSRLQRLASDPKSYDPRDILKEKPEKQEAPRMPFRRPAEPEPDFEAEFGVEETSGVYPPLRSASPFTTSPREQDPFTATPYKKAFWERKGDKADSPTSPPNPFAAAPPEQAAGIFGALREPAAVPAPPRRLGPLLLTILAIAAVAALAIFAGPTLVQRGVPWLAGLLAPGTPAATAPVTSEPVMATATLLVVATAEPASPTPAGSAGCRSWDTITVDDAGQTLCAFGIIKRRFAQGEIPFVAIFDEDQGTFMIIDRLGWHTVEPGDCVLARGTVELMRQTRPVIDVQGELERCD